MLGLGAGVAIASPARADRIRVLPEVRAGEAPSGGGSLGTDLRRFLESVRVGELQVTERDQATVSSLVIENRGSVPVLLLAGEILQGGKQNRIVLEDVLVPPRSGPLTLPVYCIEQGRWVGDGKAFVPREILAAPQLRARMLERSEQREVWAEVDRYAKRAAAPSATGSYLAIHDKAEVQAHQKDVEAAIGGKIVPGAQGAAVFVADRFVGVDLFEDGSLFAREWPKLLRASTIETYGHQVDGKTDERRLRAHVDDLLKSAAGADGSVRRGIGAGWLVEFRLSRSRGSALVAESQVVHAAIL
jgi:hypothetical protein